MQTNDEKRIVTVASLIKLPHQTPVCEYYKVLELKRFQGADRSKVKSGCVFEVKYNLNNANK